jgi:hypothetical protein
MNMRRSAAVASVALALTSLSSLSAFASTSPNDVHNEGDCNQTSRWKLTASSDNGRIRVEAEVDSGVKGQHWSWRILHNGDESARGNAVTKDGGSYKITKLVTDLPGTDRIVFKSHNAATGEQCKGSVRF